MQAMPEQTLTHAPLVWQSPKSRAQLCRRQRYGVEGAENGVEGAEDGVEGAGDGVEVLRTGGGCWGRGGGEFKLLRSQT